MPHRSLWLQEALEGPPAPALEGAQRADVAIVGGGYVGLWTSLRLKELDPSLDVAIVEQDVCGGGASGRNGGLALSWWPKLPSLAKLFGTDAAVAVALASEDAVQQVLAFCDRHGIEAGIARGGWLWTATTPAQVGAWETCVGLCERLGVGPFSRLQPEEIAARAGSAAHLAGVLDRSAATLQPAALARGLRRVALEAGVRIFENSRVIEIPRQARTPVRTSRGSISAERVVLANGAWAAGVRGLRRALVVVSSDIVATPPIPDRLERIGWVGGEGIADCQQMVDYYRTTADGRVVFGKGGWGIALGARIGAAFDRDRERAAATEADFRRIYPALADVPVAHAWSGPVDRSYNGLPLLGRLGDASPVLIGVGWSGNGVGPTWLGGRILASLALGCDDDWSRHPLVDQPIGRFPPEPVRFLGAHVVRAAVQRKEAAEARAEVPGRMLRRLASLVPAGLEDK
jgi:glycine/D-amino acid oxidase-like deaminating enzyme